MVYAKVAFDRNTLQETAPREAVEQSDHIAFGDTQMKCESVLIYAFAKMQADEEVELREGEIVAAQRIFNQ